jgi:hypothetical protein
VQAITEAQEYFDRLLAVAEREPEEADLEVPAEEASFGC